MDDKRDPRFDGFDEDTPRVPSPLSHLATETIELVSPAEEGLTTSGTFDFRGVQATSFGQLLQALPVPSFLVDQSLKIIFVNPACEKIHPMYKNIEGNAFGTLFPNPLVSKGMDSLAKRVFITRKPHVQEAVMSIEGGKIFGRIHFRALRMAGERALLVIVEDLTPEKKRLLLTQRHQIELKKEIDERQQVEKTLLESEKRYRELVENASDNIFVCDAEGRITHINPVGLRMLGYSEEEIVGRKYTDLVHPNFKEQMELFYQRQLDSKTPSTYCEYPVRRKDGGLVWFGQQTQLVVNDRRIAGFQSIARDITKRKDAEDALKRNETKFRSLAESAPFGLSVLAAETLEYVNPEFTEIFGYTLADVPDKSTLLGKVCTNDRWRENLAAKWSTGGPDGTNGKDLKPMIMPVRCKDGRNKVVSFRAVSLEDGKQILTFEDITAETIAQNRITQAKREWEKTFDAVPDLIMIVDNDHRVIRVNRAMAAKVGLEPAQVIGRSCFDLVHGRTSPSPECPHAQVLADGQEHTSEMMAPSLGGVYDVSVSPLYDARGVMQGTVHVARDVTARKQAEEALVQSEERYRQLFEISPYPMLVHREGKILLANAAAATVYGVHAREELIGKEVSDLVHSDFQARLADLACEGTESPVPAPFVEIGVVRPDGSMGYLETTAVPTKYEGEPAVLYVGQDLTERKRAEESLLRAERLKAVGELASGVAHNFNNLLQVIMTGAQLASLQMEKLGEAKDKLNQILETSRLGAETVQRLQEFAQVRHEKAHNGREEIVDLTHVTQRAIEMSEPWWKTSPEKEGIKIALHSDLEPNCFVKGREGELFEVVLNLVKNAAEALPQGGEIEITTKIEDDRVVLNVRDNGMGIAEESFGRIFEPFWTSKGFQATGMGLASSLGIVKRNGGDITVHSETHAGSTFTVILPLAADGEPPKEIVEPPVIDRKLSILAIDDTEPVVALLKDALTEFGQSVSTASSGEEGIEIFRNTPVDLVICDLAMPGMTGWSVAAAMQGICRERGVPKIPFILLTGWGVQFDEQSKLDQSGVDGIIEKPIDIKQLMTVIHQIA